MTFTVNPEKKRTWNHGWWRGWRYDDPTSQPAVAFGDMRPVSFMRLYPFYDPDLLAYLRQTGAPQGSPRSAKREARL